LGSVRGDKGVDRGDFGKGLINIGFGGHKAIIIMIMEGTRPLRGQPYPTL
jgi:hypothetical protein